MREKGLAHMGIGNASGEKRAAEAARQAIESPPRNQHQWRARRADEYYGRPDLSLLEVNEAAELIGENVDPEANIIFGADIDEAMGDALRITVIATGFDRPDRVSSIQGVPGFGAFSTFRSPYGSTGMGANQQQPMAQPQPQPQPYPTQPQPQPYPTQPQYQQPMRQPQPQQYASASYAPRRPIMTDDRWRPRFRSSGRSRSSAKTIFAETIRKNPRASWTFPHSYATVNSRIQQSAA
jgi:cell division protein FtsZ